MKSSNPVARRIGELAIGWLVLAIVAGDALKGRAEEVFQANNAAEVQGVFGILRDRHFDLSGASAMASTASIAHEGANASSQLTNTSAAGIHFAQSESSSVTANENLKAAYSSANVYHEARYLLAVDQPSDVDVARPTTAAIPIGVSWQAGTVMAHNVQEDILVPIVGGLFEVTVVEHFFYGNAPVFNRASSPGFAYGYSGVDAFARSPSVLTTTFGIQGGLPYLIGDTFIQPVLTPVSPVAATFSRQESLQMHFPAIGGRPFSLGVNASAQSDFTAFPTFAMATPAGNSGAASLNATIGPLTFSRSFIKEAANTVQPVYADHGGVMIQAEGKTAQLAQGETWNVAAGNVVKTDSTGRAFVGIPGDGYLDIKPNTEFWLENGDGGSLIARLLKGLIRLFENGSIHRTYIQTKRVAIGVRGTDVSVSYAEANGLTTTIVDVVDGIVDVTDITGATYTLTAGQSVTIVLPADSADFDGNGDVDAADLATWRMGFSAASGATHMQGDANGDSRIDGGDFLIWQQQFGIMNPGTPGAAVPEPAAWVLLVAGILAIGSRRRRNDATNQI